MDPDTEDVLDLLINPQDIEDMELEEPPPEPLHRGDREGCAPNKVAVGEVPVSISESPLEGSSARETPLGETQSEPAKKPKKKKKRDNRRSPAAIERKRLRRKETRKAWQHQLRQEWNARVKEATSQEEPQPGTSGTSSRVPIKDRVYYDELVPSAIGTYYHPGPASVVQNILPAGYYEEEDDYVAEELLDPEDRPWMKGHRKPLPPPPVALEPTASADKISLLERERQRYYESPSVKMARYAVRDKWKLAEREILLKEHNTHNFPGQRMPSDSLGSLRVILLDLERVTGQKGRHNYKYIDRRPKDDDEVVAAFLEEVRRTRVICVNTEGTEAEMKGEDGKTKPRVMLTFAALNGVVLFFNNHENVPLDLMEMISDFSFTKIGSGIVKEITELERVGVTLDNWVETGAMRLALYSHAFDPFTPDPLRKHRRTHTFGARRTGIEEQIEDLYDEQYLPPTYKRTDFRGAWSASLAQGRVPEGMWPHIWENGRVPCMFALLVVLDFAKIRDLPDNTPALGILHEALALCRGRDPEDLKKQLEPTIRPQKWWSAYKGSGTQKERMRVPADCLETVLDRRTFADFVEPLELEAPDVIALRVYARFFGSDPVPFPTHQEVGRNIRHALLTLRCTCCGSREHIANCPKVTNPSCEYEHDGEEGLRAHTTEFCPILHNYCGVCQTVGHHERVHSDATNWKTGRELRERYFRFMAVGAYTSLPYLAFHPEGYKMLTGSHWKRSYDGRVYKHAMITRYMLGIGPELQERLDALVGRYPGRTPDFEDRSWQLEAIRDNIVKANTGETIPLPRDLLMDRQTERREKELLMKQSSYEAEREEKLTAARLQANTTLTENTVGKGQGKRKRRYRSRNGPNP